VRQHEFPQTLWTGGGCAVVTGVERLGYESGSHVVRHCVLATAQRLGLLVDTPYDILASYTRLQIEVCHQLRLPQALKTHAQREDIVHETF
jgi:hypothetical protein